MTLDARVNAYRADLAAAHLRGKVEAERFVEGELARVRAPSTALRKQPRPDVAYLTEALMGELVTVYDRDEEGWAWGQLAGDGYVGWLSANDLGPIDPAPTHRVIAPHAFLYPVPGFKAQPLAALSMGAALTVTGRSERYASTPGGFIEARLIAPLNDAGPAGNDFVAVAEALLHTPYLWGGKSAKGLDCSGLVQLALAQTGVATPRDSDMQEGSLGQELPDAWRSGLPAAPHGLQRGDLVFWKGHVGIMQDKDRLLHANVHAMAVASEPLAGAIERIAAQGGGMPTRLRRP